MLIPSLRLLQRSIAGEQIDPANIDSLLASKIEEDQYLEYKRGAWLNVGTKERNRELKRYVSGFANAAGGVLLVGVAGSEGSAPNWIVDGCPISKVDSWAGQVVSQLALSPPAVVRAIPHPKGTVLLVSVDRSSKLIPYVDRGGLSYTLRVGDNTVDVPDYLAADLLLGRRERAQLKVDVDIRMQPHGEGSKLLTLSVKKIAVENIGFRSERVRVLLVGPAQAIHYSDQRPANHWAGQAMLDGLRPYVANVYSALPHVVFQGPSGDVAPFESRRVENEFVVVGEQDLPALWLGVLVVVADGSPPEFHQVSIELNPGDASGRSTLTRTPSGERGELFFGSLAGYLTLASST